MASGEAYRLGVGSKARAAYSQALTVARGMPQWSYHWWHTPCP
jgi:hypothetical protein